MSMNPDLSKNTYQHTAAWDQLVIVSSLFSGVFMPDPSGPAMISLLK